MTSSRLILVYDYVFELQRIKIRLTISKNENFEKKLKISNFLKFLMMLSVLVRIIIKTSEKID